MIKRIGNRRITASKGVEERFVRLSTSLVTGRGALSTIICTIYLSAIAVSIGQGGRNIKSATDFGFASYLMVPVVEELQLLIDVAAAQADATLRKTAEEMRLVRERVVFLFKDFFDSPLELEGLNEDIARQVQATIDAINDVKSALLKLCKNKRASDGSLDFGIPGVSIPDIPGLPGVDSMLPPCPHDVSDLSMSLGRIPRLRLPGLEFDVRYNESVEQVRGPDDVKEDVARSIGDSLSTLKAVFKAITVASPVVIVAYVVIRTHHRVRLAMIYGEHVSRHKDYTIKSYVISLAPVFATIFALILLLVVRIVIAAANDVLLDQVYFEYSGTYQCDIRMTPSGSDALADAMKNVGANRHANGSFAFSTKTYVPSMRHKVSDGELISVASVSVALILVSYLAMVAANLEDALLSSLAEDVRTRKGADDDVDRRPLTL